MNIYIANFGRGNTMWPECLSKSIVCSYEDKDLFAFWQNGDRDGYIEKCMADKLTARGLRPTKPVASRWFNTNHTISETEGDMWIHRDGDHLWWTSSLPGKVVIETRIGSGAKAEPYFVFVKRATPWSNQSKKGKTLLWRELHPKGREFLFTESTVQCVSPHNAEYALALIKGEDLRRWHSLPAWTDKAEKAKRSESRSLTPVEVSIFRMVQTAEATCANSNGQEVTRTVKNKELRFTRLGLEKYLADLMASQDRQCAITGIPFQFDTECDDGEFLPSLDRIDSNGHYEEGNLQVVCKFVNRWKSDSEDADFRRLIDVVRGAGTGL